VVVVVVVAVRVIVSYQIQGVDLARSWLRLARRWACAAGA
jgi:hypothetical protein